MENDVFDYAMQTPEFRATFKWAFIWLVVAFVLLAMAVKFMIFGVLAVFAGIACGDKLGRMSMFLAMVEEELSIQDEYSR